MITREIAKAAAILAEARLTGMDDADKFTVIRALRVLKPIRQQYEDFVQDAAKRLRPEGFDRLEQMKREWNEQHKGQKYKDLTEEELLELNDINQQYNDYNSKVEDCIREESMAEHTLSYARLSDEALGKLMAANPEWTAAAMLLVTDALAADEGKEG